MRVVTAHKSKIGPEFDTISVFDYDGREIAIHRAEIKKLIRKLKKELKLLKPVRL